MKIFRAEVNYLNLDKLPLLFFEYYHELSASGLFLPLTSNGAQLWLDGVKKSVGKTTMLVIAENNGLPVGFGQGQLKLAPDYLGNLRLGVVSHFYIDKKFRGSNTAEKMFDEMRVWFAEKMVHSIELQVLSNNVIAEKFWKKMGFIPELQQMRCLV